MSKQVVKQAIYDYLTPENSGITGLGAIYTALPKVANEADLFSFSPPGTSTGATMYMFCESQSEKRIAFGGPPTPPLGGRKWRSYRWAFLIIFKSDLGGPDAPVQGQDAFDAFVDSFTERVQSNRTANDPNVIFQWAEGDTLNSGTDLQIEFPVPKTINGGVMLFQAIARISVIEVLVT